MDAKERMEHLDYYVLKTLDTLERWRYPRLPIEDDENNVFVGSGNACNMCALFARRYNGLAVNASNYREFFERHRRLASVNILSASGGKDGAKMAEFLAGRKIEFNLITNNKDAPAKQYMDERNIYVFESFVEPPTYNVSTYSSMIYYLFDEKPLDIKKFIKEAEVPNLRKYGHIFFLADDKHEAVAMLAATKVAETLEGVASNGQGFSNGMHGFLTQPNNKRLVFCLNQEYGGEDDAFPLKMDSYLGLFLSVYYIIGKNQTDKDSENILGRYARTAQQAGWVFNKIM